MSIRVSALIFVFVLFAVPLRARQVQTRPLLSTEAEIKQEFEEVPCKSKDRLKAVRALFERMGAKPDEFSIDKHKDAENLLITRKGKEPGTIVIGAHYDFVDEGCGAIDNWTGIVAMAHAYRSMLQLDFRKTVVFAAFGNEEKGLLGSRGMAYAIPNSDLPQYCAMINIDSFGLGRPFVFENVSSKKLTVLMEEKAASLTIPIYKVGIRFADADSSSFLARAIPAVTLSGLADGWEQVLHSKNDQAFRINFNSVYLGYRLALSSLAGVDAAPCDLYREDSLAPAPSLKK